MSCRVFSFALHVAVAAGHGILISPPARPNQDEPIGAKLQPFANAKTVADVGCGGTANSDPGVQRPTVAFTPGSTIEVDWQLTIPHPADVGTPSGVRIAIHYGPTDSFADNVLAGGLVGEEPFPGGPLPAGTGQETSMEVVSTNVQLPLKPCDYCTLQWVWAAQNDGGFYIGCSDISITAGGTLPNFDALPPQTGNVLPGVPASEPLVPDRNAAPPPPGGTVGSNPSANHAEEQCDGLSTGGGFFIGCLWGFAFLFGVRFWLKSREGGTKAPRGSVKLNDGVELRGPADVVPPPPGTTLPSGWLEVMDPATNRAYFYNQSTGETSWRRPV